MGGASQATPEASEEKKGLQYGGRVEESKSLEMRK
jgi:hypothetical protein